MKQTIKKISLSVLAVMILAQSNAMAGTDFLGLTKSATSQYGSYTKTDSNGDTVRHYHNIGGSVTYKRKGAFDTIEPLMSVSEPGIKAGCNGVDMKGMFVSMLGLDRFKDMLTNAGASLAWGVVVGLIYSLPGIGNAFKMLDEWSKKIQALLANACQSGINAGKSLAESWTSKEKNTYGKDTDGEDFITSSNNKMKEWDTKMNKGLSDAGFSSDGVWTGDSPKKPTSDEIKESYAKIISIPLLSDSPATQDIMGLVEALDAEAFLNNTLGFAEDQTIEMKFFHLSFNACENGTTSQCLDYDDLNSMLINSSLNEQVKLSSELINMAIRYNTIQQNVKTIDTAVSVQETLSNIKNAIDTLDAGNQSDEEKAKISKMIDNGFYWKDVPQIPLVDANVLSEEFIEYFQTGKLKNGNTEIGLVAPQFAVIKIPGMIKGESSGVNFFIVPVTANKKYSVLKMPTTCESISVSKSTDITVEGCGVVADSAKLVNSLFNAADASAIDTILTNSTFPVLVPEIISYIGNLKYANDEDIVDLKSDIAIYNAQEFVKAMTGSLSNYLNGSKAKINAIYVNGSTVRAVNAELANMAGSWDSGSKATKLQEYADFNKNIRTVKVGDREIDKSELMQKIEEILIKIDKKSVKSSSQTK